jgi:hypothetical protein
VKQQHHRQRRARLARRRLLGDLEPAADKLLDPRLVAAAIDSQATTAPPPLIHKPPALSPTPRQPVRNRIQADEPSPGGD